jgi:hypothetical protein
VSVSKRTNIKKKGAKLFVLIAGLAELSGIIAQVFHEQRKRCSIGSKKSEGGTHRV